MSQDTTQTTLPQDTIASEPQVEELSFLALGDSYTIGESVSVQDRWPVQLVQNLASDSVLDHFNDPIIIAKTGWRTDDLLQGIEKQKPPSDFDLVGLLIGVNNQYQNRSISYYKEEFERLLIIAIEKARGNKDHVMVLSIPDYGYTLFGKSNQEHISEQLDEYNRISKDIAGKYGVQYFNITDISRMGLSNPELVADDNLHPSGEQYGLWIKRMVENRRFFSQWK